ncbi:hypothetical protein [Micromonospora sp. NBC_01813]|uniref:hypothetical protein n=1 Tax=Micromonospora sp. NBC_01813 TaxID=2975988 RepID=UPI002DD8692C|nr:hypothetical protein [Micromonospora sp. NBC_01813]WSA07930.1 hypothetical protein OG958_27545 [Micromonospora sp. NBC_01813]
MDALDRVAGPALDLLARVDDQLARHGAAAEDPVWPLLRQVRALPGDAVAAFRAVRPAPLAAAGAAIRPHLDGYAEAADALAGQVDWSGAAAQAYDAVRAALATRLTDSSAGPVSPASLAGNLAATAGYAEALADWVSSSRSALAVVLADALRSTEATTLVTAGVPGVASGLPGVRETADAAAALAVPVLTVLLEIAEQGEELLAQWRPRLALAGAAGVAPAPGAVGMRLDGVTRLRY